MKYRTIIATITLGLAGLVGPALVAAPGHAAPVQKASSARHACTKTASGSCIHGGQFCPKAKKGKFGWDGQGRKYKCKGGSHPHWRKTAAKAKKKPAGRCDSNYAGACVPIASDVDCAGGSGNGPRYVSGPVRVVGSDIYDLDRDGDGVGCD